MTVLENVKIGCHIKTKTNLADAILHTRTYKHAESFTTEKSLEILKRIGLYDCRDSLAGNLSYGIQRKVEIARALALDPKILLLDEPAAGMNPLETQSLMEVYQIAERGWLHHCRDRARYEVCDELLQPDSGAQFWSENTGRHARAGQDESGSAERLLR